MEYSVRDPMLGPPVVSYACASCGMALESPLEEAGTKQKCPTCGAPFVTPGEREARIERQKLIDKAQTEAKERGDRLQEKNARAAENALREMKAAQVELVWYGAMVCNECGYQWKARKSTPPAKCAGCGRRNIAVIREPRHAAGCLSVIVFAVGVAWLVLK